MKLTRELGSIAVGQLCGDLDEFGHPPTCMTTIHVLFMSFCAGHLLGWHGLWLSPGWRSSNLSSMKKTTCKVFAKCLSV